MNSTLKHGKEEDQIFRAKKFLKSIQKVHTKIETQLQKIQERYKKSHDRHRTEGNFQVGDLVWLHLGKERLKGEGRKLKSIHYGPLKLLMRIRDKTYQLYLPVYMKMYLMVNVENLKLFEPSMLDVEPREILS